MNDIIYGAGSDGLITSFGASILGEGLNCVGADWILANGSLSLMLTESMLPIRSILSSWGLNYACGNSYFGG